MQNLSKCMQTFNDVEAFTRAWDTFEQSHCPYRNEKHISKTHHYKVLLVVISKVRSGNSGFYLGYNRVSTPSILTPWYY